MKSFVRISILAITCGTLLAAVSDVSPAHAQRCGGTYPQCLERCIQKKKKESAAGCAYMCSHRRCPFGTPGASG